MAKKKDLTVTVENPIGKYLFMAGILFALILGVFTNFLKEQFVILVLTFLGLAVGMLNISKEEVTQFLIAAVVLVIASEIVRNSFAFIGNVGPYLTVMFSNVTVFVGMSAFIVALKSIWALGKD